VGSAASLTQEDAEAIAGSPDAPSVAVVAPVSQQRSQVVYSGQNINTSIQGVTPEYAVVRNWAVEDGRFIEKSDVDSRSRVAVLGSSAAQELFGTADPLGQSIKIQQAPYRVIGVMQAKGGTGFMGASQDDVLFIPLTTAQERLLGGRTARGGSHLVTVIYVSAIDDKSVDSAISEMTLILRQRHKIGPDKEDDFTIMSQQDILGVVNQVTGILTLFLGAIAAISLLVGGIGIMNIMLVSVTERTREIGIRKAVGARRRDILLQFLIEAIVLSVIGGLAGILFGVSVAKLVELSGVLTTLVSLDSVLLAVGFSVAVGLFFGLYPAMRAARLNPIDALRYE
jgi:putative ABC transport system permease protein